MWYKGESVLYAAKISVYQSIGKGGLLYPIDVVRYHKNKKQNLPHLPIPYYILCMTLLVVT